MLAPSHWCFITTPPIVVTPTCVYMSPPIEVSLLLPTAAGQQDMHRRTCKALLANISLYLQGGMQLNLRREKNKSLCCLCVTPWVRVACPGEGAFDATHGGKGVSHRDILFDVFSQTDTPTLSSGFVGMASMEGIALAYCFFFLPPTLISPTEKKTKTHAHNILFWDT